MPLISTRANASARGYGMFGGAAAETNSYESIASVTLGSDTNAITFSSIPSTYKHLQIRGIVRSTYPGSTESGLKMQFNGSNLTDAHGLYGSGSSASAFNQIYYFAYAPANNSLANVYGGLVIDILDYANTNKNKTVRTLAGRDENGAGSVMLTSAFQNSTSAITSVSISEYDGSFALKAGSTLALYGIKG